MNQSKKNGKKNAKTILTEAGCISVEIIQCRKIIENSKLTSNPFDKILAADLFCLGLVFNNRFLRFFVLLGNSTITALDQQTQYGHLEE